MGMKVLSDHEIPKWICNGDVVAALEWGQRPRHGLQKFQGHEQDNLDYKLQTSHTGS